MSVNNKYCCVVGCKSTFSREENIYIHLIPKAKAIRKEWEVKLKLGKPATSTMYVCSRHFLPSDYHHPGLPTKFHRLKPGSVPSVNLPQRVHEHIARKPPNAAAIKRNERMQQRAAKQTIPYPVSEPKQLPTDNPDSFKAPTLSSCHCATGSSNGDANTGNVNLSEAFELLEARTTDRHNKMIVAEKGIQVNALLDVQKPINLLDMLRNEKDLNCFTGITSFKLLKSIVSAVDLIHTNTSKLLSTEAKIVMAMVKLKTGLSFLCLSVLFQLSPTTCRAIFSETIAHLSQVLGSAIVWCSRENVLDNMPKCFGKFGDTRIVLDCTEVRVEKTKCINCRVLTYSHYYGTNTIKILIGATPAGLIVFVSDTYGGRASDKLIFEDSNLLEKLVPYVDKVMVDKGFRIDESCANHAIGIYRPPFLRKKSQFTEAESLETAEIARARVHVERGIQRIKLFDVLSSKLEWTMLPYIDMIVKTICGLVNLSAPILADERF